MSQESIDPILNNSDVCEAVNCFDKATIHLEVRIGHKGTISLSLCNDCVGKFRDEQ
jgi:hypothetical protein